jgi:hypothetical protein
LKFKEIDKYLGGYNLLHISHFGKSSYRSKMNNNHMRIIKSKFNSNRNRLVINSRRNEINKIKYNNDDDAVHEIRPLTGENKEKSIQLQEARSGKFKEKKIHLYLRK